MKFGIATVSLSGTLEDKLRAAAAAGFDGVEIFENDLIASPLRPKAVRAMMDDLGLACLLYQPFRDFEGMPGALRQKALDRAEAKFDLMGELGADRILLCSNCSPQALGERNRIVADLRELGDRAVKRNIIVGYEALAWGRHVFDHRDAWAIVEAVDHPNIGIILDSFHSLSRGIASDSIRAIPGEKIAFVQLADAPRLDMDLLYWSRHYRNFPGQGGLPVADYVVEIMKTGYDGPLSLEIFNDRFRGWSADLIAADGLRSLRHIEDAACRILDRPSAVPAAPVDVRPEFVEFAVDRQDAPALETLFQSIGFAKTGVHPIKAVSRWQAGSVNLVVNAERAGFGHSFQTTHGPSICAVGLVVPDRDAVAARAAYLGIQAVDEQDAPDNLALPALRGIGGSLIYLMAEQEVDSIWAREFQATGASVPEAPLVIDHLAAVVRIEEYLSWQLYWRSLFGLQQALQADVIDPSGLVLSQPLQSPDGSLRLTLNASDAMGTLSSRFVEHNFGGGYQHIAFATPDLIRKAGEIIADGADILPIFDNYYDDLAARFGLDDSAIETMAATNMLYDADAEGDYHQLYTRAFHKRFFFEFVERRRYEGYGAANAGVRLASQERFKAVDEGRNI
ncbi:sugar phosphate isomerase/epimerase and 4-hydroxyphenylpyruvate domain-containing protein [Sphingobium sp. BYY-5]|uniref:bifunctional sugar phosphate isomerase/epimerase/4-hydroxyphenylpyruvate dioxygenase family protein n=1 Tax=Sphingobium sp. BYY-5 TaxID=2926400 RepID=UPI001FA781DC|nr:sugar phosphate isomerase/epimerase and 4-hydroxyphenylpyruvate domain-containing protein [Sphingobium sp. BYY-5]MCI4591952.1 sugar phosphate isomerase/epimerase and 4-hydroxyphenylpyruvate domain-containing protein [Sphingobium sp. BYY-5]